MLWRCIRAPILARAGAQQDAETLVRAALDMTKQTEVPELRATACSELANVLRARGRIDECRQAPEEALKIVRNKRNEEVYRSLGLQPIFIEVPTADELDKAIKEVSQRRGQSLIVFSDHLFLANADPIMQAALRYALPTAVEGPIMLEAGGLISYAVSVEEARRRVAALIDKILHGAKPADLPIEQPTRFDLGINLKTAKALGLTIPKELLLRATEVIQ